VYDRLRPYAGRYLVNGMTPNWYGAAAHYLGLLAATQQHWDVAIGHFASALEMNRRTGVRPAIVRTECEYAAALAGRARAEDRARAMALVDDALGGAEALGMHGVRERACALRNTLTEAADPEAVPHRGARGSGSKNWAAALPDELTPRERDVLRLLAAGLSNRQIAEELVVTVNTVERHLVNIYDKLGVRGRSAATAYALRHHLA
jgi:ATP/maltotriose-dependent transcriptional regulator MalT